MKQIRCWLKAIAHFVRTGEWQPHEYVFESLVSEYKEGKLIDISVFSCRHCGKVKIFDCK